MPAFQDRRDYGRSTNFTTRRGPGLCLLGGFDVLLIQVVQGLPMIIGEHEMKNDRLAKQRAEVSVDESVRILRELRELTQSQPDELIRISQATISPGWEVVLECAA